MKVCLVASCSVSLIGGEATFLRHIAEANQILGNEVWLVNPGPPCDSFRGVHVINVNDSMQGISDLSFFISRCYNQASKVAANLGPLTPILMPPYWNNYVAKIAAVLRIIEGIDIFHAIAPFAAYALKQAGQEYLALCVAMQYLTYKHIFKSRGIPDFLAARAINTLRKFEVEGYSGAGVMTTNGLDLLQYLEEDIGMSAVQLFMSQVEVDFFSKISEEEACETLQVGQGPPVIVFVGHLENTKGLDVLINAMHILDKRGKIKPRLIVAGDGPLRPKYEKQAQRLGVEAKFFGYRKDVGNFYKAADIVVLPFKTLGGTSHVLLEALACGAPVITNKIYGRQAIPYEEQLVYAEPDNPDSYAGKIEQVLGDPALRRQLSQNAVSYINKYHTRDKFVSQVQSLYDSLNRGGRG